MKKNVYLTILFVLFSLFLAQGQTTLWSEDFEGDWYNNWYVDNGTWEVGTPTSGPNAAHAGDNCAATVLAGNYSEPVTTRLIRYTSFVVPAASENPRFRFWYWMSFAESDYGEVQIKTSGGEWESISIIMNNYGSDAWSYGSVDISAYAGSTVQIAFYFHSEEWLGYNNVSSGWYIDDVSLVTGPYVLNSPEDFESGFGDWSVDEGSWEVGIPTFGPSDAHSGQNCVGTNLEGNYQEPSDSRLASPPFVVPPASENPAVQFWHWFSFSDSDYGVVQIRVNNGDWVPISTQFSNTSSGIWTPFYISLSSYTDSTVQIAFYFHSEEWLGYNNVSSGWYIDNVNIIGYTVQSNKTDFLTYTFGLPPQTGNASINTTAYTINIEVENGTDVTNLVSNFTLSTGASAKVGGVTQVSGTTVNDFSNPVIYTVTAQDGTTVQDWEVTVSVAPPPVLCDDTWGYTDVFSSTSTSATRRAVPVTASESGSIESIAIYHNGGSGNMVLGVYSDASALPGTRLGVSASTPVSGSEGWQKVDLTSPANVASGQTLWLAWVFENNPGIRYTAGTPGRAASTATWSGGMPASFGTSSTADYIYSIYCCYSPGPVDGNTLGNTTVYSSTSTKANRRAIPVTFTEAGAIESLSIYHNGGTGNILMGVYYDNSGAPQSLLGATTTTVVNSSAGWQTISLISPVNVINGQTVWLSYVFENNPGVRYTAGTPARAQSDDTWSAGMPGTFGAASFANYKYSLYCTYTPEEPGPQPSTLGNLDVYSSTSTKANRRAIPVTFTEAGVIESLSVYHNGGSGDVLLGVYSDASGSPSSRLGVTALTPVNSSEIWQTIDLINPVTVINGQTVWLSFVFENNPGVRYTAGTPARAQSTDTWTAGMPGTFGAASFANYKYSLYCIYTPIVDDIKSGEINKELLTKNNTSKLDLTDLRVYPNPFSTKLNFEFVAANDAYVILEIYNLSGQLVERLMEQRVEGGVFNRIEYAPTEIISGVYIYRLTLDENVSVGKVIYNKR